MDAKSKWDTDEGRRLEDLLTALDMAWMGRNDPFTDVRLALMRAEMHQLDAVKAGKRAPLVLTFDFLSFLKIFPVKGADGKLIAGKLEFLKFWKDPTTLLQASFGPELANIPTVVLGLLFRGKRDRVRQAAIREAEIGATSEQLVAEHFKQSLATDRLLAKQWDWAGDR